MVNNSKNNVIWVRTPIVVYPSHGSIHVLIDEIMSASFLFIRSFTGWYNDTGIF
jgi:hypothetical protein